MPIAQTLLPEFDHEMDNPRRMLALVPAADPRLVTSGQGAALFAREPFDILA